jgi:lysophospholipase L1-like esterase
MKADPTMKHFFSILALCAISACGGGGSAGGGAIGAPGPVSAAAPPVSAPTSPPPVTARDCTAELWGDSVLAGYTAANVTLAERPAAALVRLRPAYSIRNETVPGATAGAYVSTFLQADHAGRFVVLQYGINDAGTTSTGAYEAALRGMVERAQALKRSVILTGFSRGAIANRDAFDAVARLVASSTGSTFADWGTVAYADGDNADAVHPAQAYSGRLVQRLVDVLDVLAPECSK